MRSFVITNPNAYTVPDFDSESEEDFEDEIQTIITRNIGPRFFTEQQAKKLITLGCSENPLEECKKLYFVQNPKGIDIQHDEKYNEFCLNLRKDVAAFLQQQNQKSQEKYKALPSVMQSVKIKDEDAEDKAFEEELKRDIARIDEAIAFNKKKLEEESKEAKAKAEQAKAKEEKDKKDAEEKDQKEKEKKEQEERASKLKQSSAVSVEGLEQYKTYYATIEHYKTTIKPKLSDTTFRKQCFEARRLIKRTVAQLQPNHAVIQEKANVLYQHLMSVQQQSADAYHVMLNFFSKVFLSQVKQEIHATPHASYFLARFAYHICSQIPDFIGYLMGRLMKRCPYLIPQFHDNDPSLSQEEIKSRLRYVVADKEKNQLETFLQHAEGQKCYVLFFGALTQTLPDHNQPPNPFGIKDAWIYLARVCNMPPREITPFLIMGVLEVAANRLLEAYPRQTPKLFRLLKETIIPLFPTDDTIGNLTVIKRMEMLLERYFNTGKVECLPEVIASKV